MVCYPGAYRATSEKGPLKQRFIVCHPTEEIAILYETSSSKIERRLLLTVSETRHTFFSTFFFHLSFV